MKNFIKADDPAFATSSTTRHSGTNGLTKREYFAAAAMQGLLANSKNLQVVIGESAVIMADALIKALNKPEEDE